MEKIICPSCGMKTDGKKFCTECGAFLDRNVSEIKKAEENRAPESIQPETISAFVPIMKIGEQSMKTENTSVSDQGLKMLISTCKKTMATIGGDGYNEYVLYQRDENTYELHYYSKYEYMKEEVHMAYRSDQSILEEAYKKIDELNLDIYKDYPGIGMTGGMRIVKYLRGDTMICITSDNLPMDKGGYLYEIEAIITKTAKEEYRLP